ncbi:ATP-binding protein [Acidocella sp.]|uniref:ATP-binding protein n=1 Tax=Acidocella sp. TaxID=50710 RepID=UPI00262E250E|nr:ATP-binding protein [Acidocella sp.]MDD2794378.1 ATP-binding protein [Acidocella sp.]
MSAAPVSLAQARRKRNMDNQMPEDETELACPVTPLGHFNGKFWFLNIVGEKRDLSARQLGARAELAALFLGDMAWLERSFKAFTPEGQPNGFKISKACEYLMSACREAGMFGEHVIIRRPGVWLGENGVPVAHCGDALFIEGEKFPAGQKVAGQIFATAPRMAYPAAKPADVLVARDFADDIRNFWKLAIEGGEIIALGLVGQGYLAAALSWRANGFICGGSNSGKSKLLELLHGMVPLSHYTNETSKAGVEGAVAGRALPIFIDESSDRAGGQGAQVLLDMVLSSSSGEGTKGHRGTVDGGVRTIEVVGSAIMASINPPEMQPQHRSRFAIVELLRPDEGEDNTAPMNAAIARAKAAGPALFARALQGFNRYKDSLGAFRTALGAAGCVAREMDQLGAILAGYWVLAENGLPDAITAMQLVKMVAGFIVGAEEMRQDSAPRAVLAMLLSKVVKLDRSTDEDSIAKLLRLCFGDLSEETALREQYVRVLSRWGIRPVRACDLVDRQGRAVPRLAEGDGLWIDDRWQPLKAIFAGTPYDGGRWIMELRRLPSAKKARENVRVSEIGPGKAIWISWADIDGHSED